MAIPTDLNRRTYLFSDDMKFLQKAVVYHPDKNEFLALRRPLTAFSRPGCWDLPGGNVLFGQTHQDSLLSEIREETSLQVKDVRPLQVVTSYEKEVYYLFIGYSCKALSSQVKLSSEHTEYRWVTTEEFLSLESADFLRELVLQQQSH